MRLLRLGGGLLLLLSACSLVRDAQPWHLAITDLSDPAHPGMCVSRSRNCSGASVAVPFFSVEKFDATSPAGAPRWFIEPTTNSPLREFTYGQTVPGWREVRPAPPLSLGEWYTVGRYLFRITQGDDGFRGDVCHVNEFTERIREGLTPGCRSADR
jgi:hypothetical protein